MSENVDNNLCKCKDPEKTNFDENCPQNLHSIIRKLVFLMYDPIGTNQIERQIDLLDKLISISPCAFWLHDIAYIMKLLEYLFKRVDNVCVFESRLKSLLNLTIIPPFLAKTSDVLEYSRDLVEYSSFLGYMLIEVRQVEFRDLVLLAITNFLKQTSSVAVNSVSHQTRLQSVERSLLPSVVTNLLEIADIDLYNTLLDISWLLVNISDAVCHKMIIDHALDYILIRTNVFTHLDTSCKLIWRLLEACKNETDDFKRDLTGPSVEALKSLQMLLRTLTNNNNQIYRNDIMSLLLQCIDLFPNLQLTLSGLANDIGVLCSATEFGIGGTWITNVSFGTNEYDYEFKKMLILAVCYCSKIPSTLKIVHPKRIIPSLLRIITPKLSKPWIPDQQTNLILMAISALHMIAQVVPNEFLNDNGPIRLLSLIDYFNKEPYDLLLLTDCIKSINTITTMKNKDINSSFLNHGAHKILRDICNKLLSFTSLSLTSQLCLTYAFCALETLVFIKSDEWGDAVQLCIKFMKRVVSPNLNDSVIKPELSICGLDFLWEAVIWNQENLKAFIDNGGVYLLLDLIFVSPFPVKIVGLGVLVELCDAGTCIPYLITWRNSGQSLFPMLLSIFRDECLKLGVRTTYDGTISGDHECFDFEITVAFTDVEFPLMGQQQWYETFGVQKDLNSCPATVDLLGSCRPKIYAIINLLYNRHSLSVDISNEHYHMFNPDSLKIEDKITLLLAENFLALKLGETWIEVSRDLENAGIVPLAIDAGFIAQLTHRFYKWSQHIKIAQEKLLEQKFLKEYNTEMDLYNILRESKLMESLNALRELSYIARTTERMFRLSEKEKQCHEINQFVSFSENTIHHKTFMYNLKVTTTFNQHVKLYSKQNSNWEIPSPITDSEENESEQTARLHDSLESGSH